MEVVNIKEFCIGPGHPLMIFCGVCVMESEEHTLYCASELQKIFQAYPFSFVFKGSYDKANRSSHRSFRGPGLEKGLKILQRVQSEFGVPVLTDVHSPEEAAIAGAVCDVIQIPAFLCRQTDLLVAAARTPAAINVKKGQFMAPWDMKNVVDKVTTEGNRRLILTDRGVSFGYNNLVSDMRAIPIMQKFGFPVCFDATHSAQLPGGLGEVTGGQREFIPYLAKAAVATGCNALYLEIHPKPQEAKSDAATVLSFDELKLLLPQVERLYEVVTCSVEQLQPMLH
jgi:2-dehydro-3-deoxyphosphooctonate aldolase (KDO 8-P synthase)